MQDSALSIIRPEMPGTLYSEQSQKSQTDEKQKTSMSRFSAEKVNSIKIEQKHKEEDKYEEEDKENLNNSIIKKQDIIRKHSKDSPMSIDPLASPLNNKPRQKKCKGVRSKKLLDVPPKTMILIQSPRDMVMKPVQQNQIFRASIIRSSNLFNNTLSIFMKNSDRELILANKSCTLFSKEFHFRLPSSNLEKESEENDDEKFFSNQLGYMTGDCFGSVFNVYEGDTEENAQIIGTIVYKQPEKLFGAREVQFYYRDRRFNTYIDQKHKGLNLEQIYRQDPQNKSIIQIKNIKPKYNQQLDQYFLSIQGQQSVRPSHHNIVFSDNEGKQIMKFYKNHERSYCLEVSAPLTPFMGYCYAVTSFNFKLASQ